MKWSKMQGTTIVLGVKIVETNVHSTIFNFLKPATKLLSIYRLKYNKLHFINVFQE